MAAAPNLRLVCDLSSLQICDLTSTLSALGRNLRWAMTSLVTGLTAVICVPPVQRADAEFNSSSLRVVNRISVAGRLSRSAQTFGSHRTYKPIGSWRYHSMTVRAYLRQPPNTDQQDIIGGNCGRSRALIVMPYKAFLEIRELASLQSRHRCARESGMRIG